MLNIWVWLSTQMDEFSRPTGVGFLDFKIQEITNKIIINFLVN